MTNDLPAPDYGLSNPFATRPDESLAKSGEGFASPGFRPHAFALLHGNEGAKIAYGELHYGVTSQTVTREEVAGKRVVTSITQNPIRGGLIATPEVQGEFMDTRAPNTYHELGEFGDVYLYWEYTLGSGSVDVCEVVVGKPEDADISFLNANLERQGGETSGCIGKFAILLGSVNEGSPVQQAVSSDVTWFAHIVQDEDSCSSGSSSSSSDSSSSESSSSSDSDSSSSEESRSSSSSSGNSSSSPSLGSGSSGGDSSSKDTCIVPVPKWFYATGYAALFVMESPEVRFEDFMQVEIRGRITRVPVDPKYVVVCEPGTLQVRSVQHKKAVALGGCIEYDGHLYVDAGPLWFLKRGLANVSITGIRRGFLHSSNPDDPFYDTRFAQRTGKQFSENEESILSHYSR